MKVNIPVEIKIGILTVEDATTEELLMALGTLKSTIDEMENSMNLLSFEIRNRKEPYNGTEN